VNCTSSCGDELISAPFADVICPSQILYRFSNEEAEIWCPFTDTGSSVNNVSYITTRH
jgi:hypothetical protein